MNPLYLFINIEQEAIHPVFSDYSVFLLYAHSASFSMNVPDVIDFFIMQQKVTQPVPL
jgi:hypothetical protein